MLKKVLCCGIPVALKIASENAIIFRGSFYVVRLMDREIGDNAFSHKTPLHNSLASSIFSKPTCFNLLCVVCIKSRDSIWIAQSTLVW